MPAPLIEVEGLCKQFGGLKVLDGASFSVSQGETLGLIWDQRLRKDHYWSMHDAPGEARLRRDCI